MPVDADPLASLASLPGVADAVAEARAAVDDLRGHRVLRRYGEKVAGESALRGARASAALEGADLPLDVVRRTVGAGGRLPAAEEGMVRGALRVLAEIGSQQEAWKRAPLQVLARLHTLAAADLTDAESLGRPRAEASARVASLAALLTAPTAAPAIVVGAALHGEILASAVFAQGNGLVARAADRLVLVTRGLDPGGVSVPEVGHVDMGRPAYDEALAGYATGSAEGLAGWVVHCARASALGAREGIAVCEAIRRGA